MNQNLDEIYRTYSSVLYKICLRYANSKAEAEDILHDSFIRIYERLPQYKGAGSLEGWLKRVVVSVALNKLRTNRFTPKYHEDFDDINESKIEVDDGEKMSTDREKLLNAGLTHDDVLTCMQKLPVKARAVFNLYVFEEKKHKEIAKELGITSSTSKTQLKRARVLLNELLIKHTEMRMKDLKKLSVFAIFTGKGEYAHIDNFVKERINSAQITSPPMDMSTIMSEAGNVASSATTSIGSNLLTQIATHVKTHLITYTVSTAIMSAISVGTINWLSTEKQENQMIEYMLPRTNMLNFIEVDEDNIINDLDSFAPINTRAAKKPTEVQKLNSQPDTITYYERVRVIDSSK